MRLARNSSSSHNANGIYVEQLHSGAAFARGLKSALASCKTLARARRSRRAKHKHSYSCMAVLL